MTAARVSRSEDEDTLDGGLQFVQPLHGREFQILPKQRSVDVTLEGLDHRIRRAPVDTAARGRHVASVSPGGQERGHIWNASRTPAFEMCTLGTPREALPPTQQRRGSEWSPRSRTRPPSFDSESRQRRRRRSSRVRVREGDWITSRPPSARGVNMTSAPHGRASSTMLNGVSVARRHRVNPP